MFDDIVYILCCICGKPIRKYIFDYYGQNVCGFDCMTKLPNLGKSPYEKCDFENTKIDKIVWWERKVYLKNKQFEDKRGYLPPYCDCALSKNKKQEK
jgi:hypothetical protein